MITRWKLVALLTLFAAAPAWALEPPLPKFGPEAVPIFRENAFLREAPAPDYWNVSPFYISQQGVADCSVAAITMVVNALRGLPEKAEEELVTENALMAGVGSQDWMVKVTEDGTGVTFEETQLYLRRALDVFGLTDVAITAVQPAGANDAALGGLREALAENETSADNVMLVYFNQGVITGDWDGPHISAIGAYDAANDRVLIMDVDRKWYVPYWTSTETLLAALVKPIGEEHVGLAGGIGGYILAAKP